MSLSGFLDIKLCSKVPREASPNGYRAKVDEEDPGGAV